MLIEDESTHLSEINFLIDSTTPYFSNQAQVLLSHYVFYYYSVTSFSINR